MFRPQRTVDQTDRDHVLQTMISIGRIPQRTRLINDSHCRFLGRNLDTLNLVETTFYLWMQTYGGFDGRLSMKLRRERNFEQNVLHNITVKRSCQLD